MPYNEATDRLWRWDATAVEMGKEIRDGLCAAIALQMARTARATGLNVQGSRHPLFNDLLSQQWSVGENNIAQKKSVTLMNSITLPRLTSGQCSIP